MLMYLYTEVVLESLDAVSCHRAKPLKEGYVADLTRYTAHLHERDRRHACTVELL